MAKKLTDLEQQEFDQLKARLERMGEKVSPNIGLDTLRKKANAMLNDEDIEDEEFEEDFDDEEGSDLVDLDEDETEDTILDDDESDFEPKSVDVDLSSQLANVDVDLVQKTTPKIKPVPTKDAMKLLAVKGSADDGRLTSMEISQALRKAPAKVRQQVQIRSANRLIRIRFTNHNPHKAKWPGEYLTTGNTLIGRITKFIPFDEASQKGYMVPYAIYEMMRDKRYYAPKVINDDQKTSKVIDVHPKEYSIEILPLPSQAELTKIAQRQAAQGND